MKYIRFQINTKDEWSTKPQGVFHALYDLVDNRAVLAYHADHAQKLIQRYKEYLPVPTHFSRKRSHRKTRGISWWKETASLYLEKMEEMIYLLEEYDIMVEKVMSDNPGYIIYEDEWQIVAEPFR